MARIYIDDFVFIKGKALFSDTFTPPIAEEVVNGDIPISTYSQRYPLIFNNLSDISSSDFSIDVDIYLKTLYLWLAYNNRNIPGEKKQTYYICGQWTQNTDGTVMDGADYWSLYLRVNEDYTIDVVFDVFSAGSLMVRLYHPISITWDYVNAVTSENASEDNINIVVSRNGNDVRLFVNGIYSDEPTSYGTMTDFSTINGSVQVNGRLDAPSTYQPLSAFYVNNLRIFNWSHIWDEFSISPIPWWQGSGIGIFPVLKLRMVNGEPSTIRARLGV